MMSPEQPAKYERLGPAIGIASGSLGILGTAYYFIPMGLNDRVERAYDAADESVPGTTGLIDIKKGGASWKEELGNLAC